MVVFESVLAVGLLTVILALTFGGRSGNGAKYQDEVLAAYLNSTASYALLAGTYSHYTFVCDKKQWHWHKGALTTPAHYLATVYKKKSKELRVALTSEDCAIMPGLMRYLDPLGSSGSKPARSPLQDHIRIYLMAKRSRLATLEGMALTNVHQGLQILWDKQIFADVMAEVYTVDAKLGRDLRRAVVQVTVQHDAVLFGSKRRYRRFKSIALANRQFMGDLLEAREAGTSAEVIAAYLPSKEEDAFRSGPITIFSNGKGHEWYFREGRVYSSPDYYWPWWLKQCFKVSQALASNASDHADRIQGVGVLNIVLDPTDYALVSVPLLHYFQVNRGVCQKYNDNYFDNAVQHARFYSLGEVYSYDLLRDATLVKFDKEVQALRMPNSSATRKFARIVADVYASEWRDGTVLRELRKIVVGVAHEHRSVLFAPGKQHAEFQVMAWATPAFVMEVDIARWMDVVVGVPVPPLHPPLVVGLA
ncbi:hypothetical protein LTR27_009908 [Elasticomyces elasticus]|nr:hypothetical protein LTR27_009908 [Elasticomyces elasticus]